MTQSLLPPSSADRVTRAREAAEAAVRAYCGWHIAPVKTETIKLDGTGTRTLFLPSLHVTDITALKVCGVVQDVTNLEWSQNGFVRAHRRWPDRLRAVEITFSHGFESAPDVAEIVLAIADREVASPSGVVREQAGQVSVSYSQVAPGVAGGIALLAHEKAILDKYNVHLRGA